MAKQKRGKEAFEERYQEYLKALKQKSFPILRFNPKHKNTLKNAWDKLSWETLDWYPYAIKWPKEIPLGQDLPCKDENLFYIQNASSLLPVMALDIQKDDKVLDACAAPGGKALFIAEQLQEGHLTVNDLSQKRMQRLRQIFKDYGINNFTHHTGNAATLFKKYPNHFDKILLDAPCSSEKHIYNSPKHLKQWSPGRIRQLKQTQISLINGLYLALKPGGTMVYSTCSINQEENQKVIEKFLKKYPEAKLISTKYIDIRESKNENLDPMFVAKITRQNQDAS